MEGVRGCERDGWVFVVQSFSQLGNAASRAHFAQCSRACRPYLCFSIRQGPLGELSSLRIVAQQSQSECGALTFSDLASRACLFNRLTSFVFGALVWGRHSLRFAVSVLWVWWSRGML